ncbi:hypothetical protein K1719_014345 [Acacia pycnantha]|nr:hypothetical protein K1719_014345 [Acacia pycnantha]
MAPEKRMLPFPLMMRDLWSQVTEANTDKTHKANNDGSGDDSSNQNWLGFSLSPHMKMELTSGPPLHHHDYHQPQASTAAVSSSVPTTFCLSPSQLSTYGICYGAAENTCFHSLG